MHLEYCTFKENSVDNRDRAFCSEDLKCTSSAEFSLFLTRNIIEQKKNSVNYGFVTYSNTYTQ